MLEDNETPKYVRAQKTYHLYTLIEYTHTERESIHSHKTLRFSFYKQQIF